MSKLLQDLRESAPVAAQAFEYLVVPLQFHREEALEVLSKHVTPNGYNPKFIDTLAATGLLRPRANGFSVAEQTRIAVLDVLSPPRLSLIAHAWESIIEQRNDASNSVLDLAYLGLLAGKTESALVARAEFAKAEAAHAVERQAMMARLISQGSRSFGILPHDVQASMFYVLGINHYREGRRRLAEEFFMRAIQTGARNLDVAICAHLLANLRARSRNRWPESEALYKESISIRQELGDTFGIAHTKHSYANLLAQQKHRWSDAEAMYQESLELGENLGIGYHIAQAKHSYGNLLVQQKHRWRDAEALYNESISIRQELGDQFGIGQTKHSYANFLSRQRHRWSDAETLYKESISTLQDLEDSFSVAQVMHSYANLLARQKHRWSDAEALYKQSVSIRQELGDTFGNAQTKHSYANLLAQQKHRWSDAEALYEDSLELGEELGNDFHIAQVSFKYGEFLCSNEIDLTRGLDLLKTSLNLNVQLRTRYTEHVREVYEHYSRQEKK